MSALTLHDIAYRVAKHGRITRDEPRQEELDAIIADLRRLTSQAGTAIGIDLASGPEVTVVSHVSAGGEHQVVEISCHCPEHGSWIHADDINRMVREIAVAMYGDTAARHPKLCDIVVDVVRMAEAWRAERTQTWHSMETAPRDGSVVLLRRGHEIDAPESPAWYDELNGSSRGVWVYLDRNASKGCRGWRTALARGIRPSQYLWRPYPPAAVDLLGISQALGLHDAMHGIRATEAKQLLAAFLFAVDEEIRS